MLIDVSTVREYFGYSTDFISDSALSNVIGYSQKIIERLCGYSKLEDDGEDIIDKFFTKKNTVYLSSIPVATISTITIDDISWNLDQFYIIEKSGMIRCKNSLNTIIPHFWEVQYRAGYTSFTVPDDLKFAILELSGYIINNKGEFDIRRLKIGDMTLEKIYQYGIPPFIKSIIDSNSIRVR
ncbi:MAG: hypothetical protein ACTSRP_02050 [Candidatus Helarchaeota archaeon]